MKKLILCILTLLIGCSAVVYAEGEEAENQPHRIIYAAESELVLHDGDVYNMYMRPFIYMGSSYIPLRNAVEGMGGTVSYIGETNSVLCEYKGKSFEIGMNDSGIRVYDDTSFIKIRDVCEALGIYIGWNDGIISVSDEEMQLSDEDAAYYKEILGYTGHGDKYLSEIHYTVNPYDVYTYDEMQEDIYELAELYPQLISVYSLGKSAEGRDMTAFNLGNGEKKIIMCGGMHAREYIASIFLMYIADRYSYGYVMDEYLDGYSIREALDKATFIFIPMMNPDGTNIVQNGFEASLNPDAVAAMPITEWGGDHPWSSWKANARGVDLNKNYPINWGPTQSQPSSAGYSGPYENSEPETQVMVELVNNTDFEILASFHSQGQVIYWMDDICNQNLAPKFSPYINRICYETGFEKMPSTYSRGNSGFLTDYVRCTKEKMAMTIELCEYIGDYPYPEWDFNSVADPIDQIGLILSDIAQEL